MWHGRQGDLITLVLHVQPGARRTEVVGLHDAALKIRLAAPALEGRANEALLRFVADCFEVPLRNVQLERGAQSRHKTVTVRGSTVQPTNLLLLAGHKKGG